MESDLPTKPAARASAAGDELIRFRDADLVIGLVAPVGADLDYVTESLSDQLERASYQPIPIRVSKDIIAKVTPLNRDGMREAEAIRVFREAGDRLRKDSGDHAILADGVARAISGRRQTGARRHAFIVNSLKHPDEVRRLRSIYGGGFYLIAVSPDDAIRRAFLKRKSVADDEVVKLMEGDHDDSAPYGQRVSDTFHLADFFLRIAGNDPRLQGDVLRVCRILFGDPFATPTFDEYAMFLAFASSVRSADLSRQVGAVVARNQDILSTGANDCPRWGGGLYWPDWVESLGRVGDEERTRDYVAGGDPNRLQREAIIADIVRSGEAVGLDRPLLERVLRESALKDITEYQRAVHAEMEALLSAARNGIETRRATLYCTTFPCHNCAKHIVAAGIERVLFIEPYRKSKALELHPDAILLGPGGIESPGVPLSDKVTFVPFSGVGPRRFFDFFSVRLGIGREVDRRSYTPSWDLDVPQAQSVPTLRVQMRPASFIDLEREAAQRFDSLSR